MATNAPHYEPANAGVFDIATTSVGKTYTFTADADFSANAVVSFTLRGREVVRYSVGSGIVLTNANRTLTLTIDGADFAYLGGERLQANCSLFVDGDVEVLFDLEIIKKTV